MIDGTHVLKLGCSVCGVEKIHSKGMCRLHYQIAWRLGNAKKGNCKCGEPIFMKGLCSVHYYRGWSAANREKQRGYSARYNAANPEKRLAMNAAWKKANKAHIAKVEKVRRQKSIEKFLAYEAKYRKDNAAIIKAKRHADKEGQRTQSAIKRARKRGAEGKHTKDEVAALHLKQKGCCAVCRVKLDSKYHRDHIVPLVAGGSNWISNIQLLCPTCNMSKKDKHPIEFMQSRGFLL